MSNGNGKTPGKREPLIISISILDGGPNLGLQPSFQVSRDPETVDELCTAIAFTASLEARLVGLLVALQHKEAAATLAANQPKIVVPGHPKPTLLPQAPAPAADASPGG